MRRRTDKRARSTKRRPRRAPRTAAPLESSTSGSGLAHGSTHGRGDERVDSRLPSWPRCTRKPPHRIAQMAVVWSTGRERFVQARRRLLARFPRLPEMRPRRHPEPNPAELMLAGTLLVRVNPAGRPGLDQSGLGNTAATPASRLDVFDSEGAKRAAPAPVSLPIRSRAASHSMSVAWTRLDAARDGSENPPEPVPFRWLGTCRRRQGSPRESSGTCPSQVARHVQAPSLSHWRQVPRRLRRVKTCTSASPM